MKFVRAVNHKHLVLQTHWKFVRKPSRSTWTKQRSVTGSPMTALWGQRSQLPVSQEVKTSGWSCRLWFSGYCASRPPPNLYFRDQRWWFGLSGDTYHSANCAITASINGSVWWRYDLTPCLYPHRRWSRKVLLFKLSAPSCGLKRYYTNVEPRSRSPAVDIRDVCDINPKQPCLDSADSFSHSGRFKLV